MAKDPYASLGVKRSATQDEIKAAYRELAKKLHPDLNPGNKEAEQRFKDVNEAYMILSDPKKREEFDRLGEAAWGDLRRQGPFYYKTQEPGGGARYSSSFSFGGHSNEGEGFEHMFESLFGKMGGRGRFSEAFGEQPHHPKQLYQMEIDLRDAVLGSQREVTVARAIKL